MAEQEFRVIETVIVPMIGEGTISNPYRPDMPDGVFWRIVSNDEEWATVEIIETIITE